MSHAHSVLGTCACQTHEVLGANVGGEDSRAYDIPRFSFTEKVILTVGPLHLLFVFLDGIVDSEYDRYDSDGQDQPV